MIPNHNDFLDEMPRMYDVSTKDLIGPEVATGVRQTFLSLMHHNDNAYSQGPYLISHWRICKMAYIALFGK